MSDDWDFYQARVDDQPASIYLDLGIAKEAPLASHKLLGWVRLEMRDPRPDGLSSDKEFDALIAIEDALAGAIGQVGAIYVGRNTSSGCRDFYFYIDDAAAFQFGAQAVLANHPDYRSDVGTRPDANWDAYFRFLSPSDADRQRMLDRRVREALSEHGDNPNATRAIDHMVYLPDAPARHAFVARVTGEGFTIESQGGTEEGAEFVNISRQDRPAEIDPVVLHLIEICHELNGKYDGWGCEVSEEPDAGDTQH